MNTLKYRRPRQSGFSLLEVLISIVIVSFGLLGFARLQVYAIKSNRVALQRSFATLHAYNMIDCIRANRYQALRSEYNQNYGAIPVAGTVASADLSAWNASLANDLAAGEGLIAVAGNVISITIRWKEGMTSTDPYLMWSTQTSL
jgi:type IV pilus assembly protein PilV